MEKDCQNFQERIPELLTGDISSEEVAELQRHLNDCELCRKYLMALEADDKKLRKFAETMQPVVTHLENRVTDALDSYVTAKAASTESKWKKVFLNKTVRSAAAAVLLIFTGFITGRLSSPKILGFEQLQGTLEASLKSSLEPVIRQDLLEQMNQHWEPVFVESCVRFKEQLHQQVQRDLSEFAAQTLAASRTLTEQHLIEFIKLIEAARMRDRLRVVTALEQIELNRLQDKNQFRNGLQLLTARKEEPQTFKEN